MKIPFVPEKKDDKNADQGVASGTIGIRVFMRFGAEIRQLKAKYSATEKRDNFNNLVSINQEFLHDQDVDFSQEEVYSGMNITLGLQDKTTEKQIEVLNGLIDKHTKRISALNKHPELNALANIWDEKRKLREAEILKRYVKYHSSRGAYFTIEDNLRIYTFESIDGFLIPIWHGADNLSDYPDFTRKKKITMQETANLEEYFTQKGTQKKMLNAIVIVLAITTFFCIASMIMGYKVWNMHNDLQEKGNAGIYSCIDQTAKTQSMFNKLMQDATIQNCIAERNQSPTVVQPNIRRILPNG